MSEHDAPSEVTKVARDLSEILSLTEALEDQAVAKSTDREMPGGAAMVALGPVASPQAWEFVYEAREEFGRDASHVADQDEDWAPPLQLLLFWSEQLRVEHNRESDRRPTIASEVEFLRGALDWLWANEPHFDDFATDVRTAKTKLEDMLLAGKRTQRGVRCFDCDVDLVRTSADRHEPRFCKGDGDRCHWPHRFCPHDRGGLGDEWVCPSCNRRYDVDQYRRAVSQAHFVHANWLTLEDCMQRTGAKRGSIQGWASRDQVRKRRDPESGRMTYNVEDIENRLVDSAAEVA